MIGNENFPSEMSSARPLVSVYYDHWIVSELLYGARETTDFFALQVHVVISNLAEYSNKIDQVNQVPSSLNWNNMNLGTSVGLHVGIC